MGGKQGLRILPHKTDLLWKIPQRRTQIRLETDQGGSLMYIEENNKIFVSLKRQRLKNRKISITPTPRTT